MPTIEVKAYAKLNLTLDVLGRREDGYHELRMVMQSVALSDTLRVTTHTGGGLAVSTDKSFLPCDERNLAAAAALRFQEAAGVDLGGAAIGIEKRIPVCAGMAGGSSDAAAVLRALDELAQTNLTAAALAKIGEAVGSAVPYCVHGGTALAEGRGELITPLPPLPSCHIVLCKPYFSSSTPELFRQLDSVRLRRRPDTAGIISALEAGDLEGVARRLYNVFEDVFPSRRAVEITGIKNTLIQHGALGACMSGTGPTVFGLFPEGDCARRAYEDLGQPYPATVLTKSI